MNKKRMNNKIVRGIISVLVVVIFTAMGVFVGTKLDNDSPMVIAETPSTLTPEPSSTPDPTPEPSEEPSSTPEPSEEPSSTPDPTPEPSEEPSSTSGLGILEPIANPVYGFNQQEIFLMAQLLCGDKNRDGDGEYDIDFGNDDRYDQISLVLCVVMNRVNDDRFPNTVEDVIWQNNGTTYQFSVMEQWDDFNNVCIPSDIAIQRVTEWCDAYDRGDPGAQSIPTDHVMFVGNGDENISSTMN